MEALEHRFPTVDLGHDRVDALLRAYERDRVPPLLFTGPDGAAKEVVAMDFARRLSCERVTAGEAACGLSADLCPSCQQAVLLEHPGIQLVYPTPTQGSGEKAGDDEGDLRKILDEKRQDIFSTHRFSKKTSIRVARGRAMIQRAASRPFAGRYNVFIVVDAHEMREETQNSLLKLVEEPPDSCRLMFVTSQPDAILYTIRSRCQRIRFMPLKQGVIEVLLGEYYGVPTAEAARAAGLAQGSIRRARVLAAEQDDDLRAAAHETMQRIAEAPPSWLLARAAEVSRGAQRDRVARFLHEMAVACRDMMSGDAGLCINKDRARELNASADAWDRRRLAAVVRRLVGTRDEVLRRNLNTEAALVDLFLDIRRNR